MRVTASKRKIGNSSSSITGVFDSNKAYKYYTSHESSLERDLIYRLELDFNVTSFIEQPFRIEYTDSNGSLKKYYPDFYIQFRKDRSPKFKDLIVEVKYRGDLRENFKKYKAKFYAGISFAKEMGCQFRILTEVEIRDEFLINAHFLRRFINADVNSHELELVYFTLKELKVSNPAELINFITGDEEYQSYLLHHLWSLIANGMILCNLNSKLTMMSEIWT